jgi:hypothetical protein
MPSDASALIVRTLDILARGGATGTVRVRSATRTGSVSLVGGRVAHVDAPGAAPLLGELLGIASEPSGRDGWIGERLQHAGLATRGAVLGAHREQMRARLVAMMSWRGITTSFESASPRIAPGVEPAHTADLVVEALRRLVAELPVDRARERLAAHAWSLTALGRSLLGRAALHPHEAALAGLLAAPTDLAAMERSLEGSERALRFAFALAFVEAAALPAESGSMTLLARKVREVERAATPSRLLDLRADARPAEARGALRRFARDLHPDRFAAHAPAAIQEASTAVVKAMTRAAASVR